MTQSKILELADGLGVTCTFDNPTSNELNWGEGTSDEMCVGVYDVTE